MGSFSDPCCCCRRRIYLKRVRHAAPRWCRELPAVKQIFVRGAAKCRLGAELGLWRAALHWNVRISRIPILFFSSFFFLSCMRSFSAPSTWQASSMMLWAWALALLLLYRRILLRPQFCSGGPNSVVILCRLIPTPPSRALLISPLTLETP